MRFTYFSFNQKEAVEKGLDLIDLALLDYFVKFKDSGAMKSMIIKDDKYYWIQYQYIIEENPIFSISSKDVIGRRFKKLCKCGVLKQEVIKAGGSFTYFAIGDSYKDLVGNTAREDGDIQGDKPKEKKRTIKDMVEDYTPKGGELYNCMIDFLEMRKAAKKNVNTEKALSLLFKSLEKLSDDEYTKIKIVEQSIERGWSTFYELKQQGSSYTPKPKEKSKEEVKAAQMAWANS